MLFLFIHIFLTNPAASEISIAPRLSSSPGPFGDPFLHLIATDSTPSLTEDFVSDFEHTRRRGLDGELSVFEMYRLGLGLSWYYPGFRILFVLGAFLSVYLILNALFYFHWRFYGKGQKPTALKALAAEMKGRKKWAQKRNIYLYLLTFLMVISCIGILLAFVFNNKTSDVSTDKYVSFNRNMTLEDVADSSDNLGNFADFFLEWNRTLDKFSTDSISNEMTQVQIDTLSKRIEELFERLFDNTLDNTEINSNDQSTCVQPLKEFATILREVQDPQSNLTMHAKTFLELNTTHILKTLRNIPKKLAQIALSIHGGQISKGPQHRLLDELLSTLNIFDVNENLKVQDLDLPSIIIIYNRMLENVKKTDPIHRWSDLPDIKAIVPLAWNEVVKETQSISEMSKEVRASMDNFYAVFSKLVSQFLALNPGSAVSYWWFFGLTILMLSLLVALVTFSGMAMGTKRRAGQERVLTVSIGMMMVVVPLLTAACSFLFVTFGIAEVVFCAPLNVPVGGSTDSIDTLIQGFLRTSLIEPQDTWLHNLKFFNAFWTRCAKYSYLDSLEIFGQSGLETSSSANNLLNAMLASIAEKYSVDRVTKLDKAIMELHFVFANINLTEQIKLLNIRMIDVSPVQYKAYEIALQNLKEVYDAKLERKYFQEFDDQVRKVVDPIMNGQQAAINRIQQLQILSDHWHRMNENVKNCNPVLLKSTKNTIKNVLGQYETRRELMAKLIFAVFHHWRGVGCEEIYREGHRITDRLCTKVINPFNGFLYSLGLSVILYPAIVCSIIMILKLNWIANYAKFDPDKTHRATTKSGASSKRGKHKQRKTETTYASSATGARSEKSGTETSTNYSSY